MVDYIQGSVEPFYKDTSLVNLSRTLDQNIDAYPFLKNVDVVTHSDLIMLNMRGSLLATYPNVLERTIYRYQLKSTQELQADAEDSLVNIKKYHRDVVGEHNTLFVPQEISKEYFDAMQFIPADPFSFKVLQGLKSNCDIQELYVEGNRSKPKPYLDRQDKIWRSMKDAFGSPADGYAFTQLKHNILE